MAAGVRICAIPVCRLRSVVCCSERHSSPAATAIATGCTSRELSTKGSAAASWPAAAAKSTTRSPNAAPASPPSDRPDEHRAELRDAHACVHTPEHDRWRERLTQADRVDLGDGRARVGHQLIADEQRAAGDGRALSEWDAQRPDRAAGQSRDDGAAWAEAAGDRSGEGGAAERCRAADGEDHPQHTGVEAKRPRHEQQDDRTAQRRRRARKSSC